MHYLRTQREKAMINKSNISRILSFSVALAGLLLICGAAVQVDAQSRDPFVKPGYAKTKQAGSGQSGKGGPKTPLIPGLPPIEQRIEYYKRQREMAAANGAPLPKVTSVLTLNEMAVTGIFKTPRGYAAMVEATPIKLSYTIYPGEKFFDGQLVAVEENRLIFRRVTKTAPGKFVASVENKPLRQFSTKSQIEGTAPVQPADQQTEASNNNSSHPGASNSKDAKPVMPVAIISPLDEMNKTPQKAETEKDKAGKNSKKPAKVAKNK
jgi:hypothetical protein